MSTFKNWKNPLGITQKTLPPLYGIAKRMMTCDYPRYKQFRPYFDPLTAMVSAKEEYGADTGVSVCVYALSNWTGSRSKVPSAEYPGTPLRTVIAEMLRAQVFVAEGGELPVGVEKGEA